MAYLVLVRHGQTDWNALGLFSGKTDVPLNKTGIAEAEKAAALLADLELHKAYTSELSRARDTLMHILRSLGKDSLEVTAHPSLVERDYGSFEGKSKHEAAEEFGEEEVRRLRREWEYPVPKGETMKAVYDRVVPFYESHVLQDLREHKNVIVSAHSNVLRALIKHLDNLSEAEVEKLELKNAAVYVYEIDANATIIKKEIR